MREGHRALRALVSLLVALPLIQSSATTSFAQAQPTCYVQSPFLGIWQTENSGRLVHGNHVIQCNGNVAWIGVNGKLTRTTNASGTVAKDYASNTCGGKSSCATNTFSKVEAGTWHAYSWGWYSHYPDQSHKIWFADRRSDCKYYS